MNIREYFSSILNLRNYNHLKCVIGSDEGSEEIIVVSRKMTESSENDAEIQKVINLFQENIKVNVNIDFDNFHVEIDYDPTRLGYYIGVENKKNKKYRYIITDLAKDGKVFVKMRLNERISMLRLIPENQVMKQFNKIWHV